MRDGAYPPFQECNVFIAGHHFRDYPFKTREYLRFLDSHMKYWSMIFTLENFMGIISSFPDTPDFQQIQVRKLDALEYLLGIKIDPSYVSILKKMRDDLHDFSYYGLGSNFRGLEEDASTQYTPRYIAGEYLHYFKEDDVSFAKSIIRGVDKDSVNKLKEDLDNLWGDLIDRINTFINKTRSQENAFYRTYEIKLSVRTQQLTLLSIIVAIIIYLLTTLPSAFR